MIYLEGQIKEIKKQEFDNEGSKRVVYDLIVDVGRPYPEVVRVDSLGDLEVGSKLDFPVRASAYSRTEKRYLKVIFYPLPDDND